MNECKKFHESKSQVYVNSETITKQIMSLVIRHGILTGDVSKFSGLIRMKLPDRRLQFLNLLMFDPGHSEIMKTKIAYGRIEVNL